MNRYIQPDINGNLFGTIIYNSHIIYPTTMEDHSNSTSHMNQIYELTAVTENTSYSKTSYFPMLYWKWTAHSYYTEMSGYSGTYHFESVEPPIDFIQDDTTKYILSINESKNDLAKYDVKLWNQCKVESGIYSFKKFVNIDDNNNKFISTDTLEDLFMDGKTYRPANSKYSFYGLLNNMPNIINTGIVGNKNIIVNNIDVGNTLNINCNISKFAGKFFIVPGITQVVFSNGTDTSNNKWKIVKNQQFKYTFISDSEDDSNSKVIVKEEQFGSNIEGIKLGTTKITKNSSKWNNCFVDNDGKILDYRDTIKHINLYNECGIKWDLSTIEECFQDGNTYNPSESETSGLLNNIPINILQNEIKIDLIGDKQIKLYSNTEYDFVTFSGNNSQYTGTVLIPSNIVKIYFKNEESKVKLSIGDKKYTAIKDNTVMVLNEYKNNTKIYYNYSQITDDSTPIKLNDINVIDDERDTISNIEKYNINGIEWNTNKIEECFKDGNGLLNILPINTINANLTGSAPIIINTMDKTLILLGNNNKYTGTMTIPESITDVYLKTISDIKNIQWYKV